VEDRLEWVQDRGNGLNVNRLGAWGVLAYAYGVRGVGLMASVRTEGLPKGAAFLRDGGAVQ
jgi:hypothetical protein